MPKLLHPLLALIASSTESELAKYVDYLKTENRILQARLPKKIDTTEAERTQFLEAGKPLGSKVKELVTIVTPRTFLRWLQADREAGVKREEKGNPAKPDASTRGNRKCLGLGCLEFGVSSPRDRADGSSGRPVRC